MIMRQKFNHHNESVNFHQNQKKARSVKSQVRSNIKVMLTVFFDTLGVMHHEFLTEGQTVN